MTRRNDGRPNRGASMGASTVVFSIKCLVNRLCCHAAFRAVALVGMHGALRPALHACERSSRSNWALTTVCFVPRGHKEDGCEWGWGGESERSRIAASPEGVNIKSVLAQIACLSNMPRSHVQAACLIVCSAAAPVACLGCIYHIFVRSAEKLLPFAASFFGKRFSRSISAFGHFGASLRALSMRRLACHVCVP